MEPDKEQPDPMARIHHIIDNAPGRIHEEQVSTNGANDWVACLVTNSSSIETWLYIAEFDGQISPAEYQKYQDRLEILKRHIYEYRRTNMNHDDNPSEEEKEKFLRELNIFKDPEAESTQ